MSNITTKPNRFSKSLGTGEIPPSEPGSLEPNTLIIENEALRRGFTITPNYILRDAKVSIAAKLTYILLLSYAWQEGSCFPGQERLAGDLGVTRQAINKYLRELKEKEFISWTRRGMGKTNVYVIRDIKSRSKSDVNKRLHQDVNGRIHKDVNAALHQDVKERLHKQDTVYKNEERKEQQQQESADKSEGLDVVVALTERGISLNVAKKLASEHSAELIANKIELVDFLEESNSKLVKKNPAGYLRKAIEEDYQAPPGFKTKAQRDAERQAQQELGLLMQRQEEERTQEREVVRQHWREQLIARHEIDADQLALWQKIKDKVRENQSLGGLKYWLDESMLLTQTDGKAVVAFRYAYPVSGLAQSVAEEVASAMSEELHRPVQVHFEVIAGAA